ncbi:hypothetical protein F5051DRAFT_433805, partial [Lentinula edodes]
SPHQYWHFPYLLVRPRQLPRLLRPSLGKTRAGPLCQGLTVEYCSVLDQFNALDRALSVFPGQTVVQRFQALEEELRVVKRDRDVAVEELSTASRKASELKTALLRQQGLVDESNALATRQHRRFEEFREEIHRTQDHAAFVEQMIKEYPDEGFYEVVLPPLSQLEEDLQRVATFAHSRGIHGDLYMQSISSIQWFFNNAVDEDEGLHRLVLEHSRPLNGDDQDSPSISQTLSPLRTDPHPYLPRSTPVPIQDSS